MFLCIPVATGASIPSRRIVLTRSRNYSVRLTGTWSSLRFTPFGQVGLNAKHRSLVEFVRRQRQSRQRQQNTRNYADGKTNSPQRIACLHPICHVSKKS